jgi:hypothetical protein
MVAVCFVRVWALPAGGLVSFPRNVDVRQFPLREMKMMEMRQ